MPESTETPRMMTGDELDLGLIRLDAALPEPALRHLEQTIAAAPPAPWLLHETGDEEDDCPRVDALWTLTIDMDTPGPLGDGDLLYFGAPDCWALTGERLDRMRATARVIQASQRAVPLLIAEVRRLRAEIAGKDAFILDQKYAAWGRD